MGATVTVIFQGGPWDGRALSFPSPLPERLVMAVTVEPATTEGMPGLEYHDYHAQPALRSCRGGRPVGPHYYVWVPSDKT